LYYGAYIRRVSVGGLFKRTGYFWHEGQLISLGKVISFMEKEQEYFCSSHLWVKAFPGLLVALDEWVGVVYSTL
jgi:hypothetical protein